MGRTKILMLGTDLEVGGVPLHLKHLACSLEPNQFEVQVACLARSGPIAEELHQSGIEVHALGAGGIWDVRVFFRLAALLRRFRPDVLHCFLVHANGVGRLVGRICGVRSIIASIHTAERAKRWHLILENMTCRLSRITVCVSPSVYHHVHTFSHVPLQRLRLIRNGIDVEQFARALAIDPNEIGLESGKMTVLFVGRLDPVKGVNLLLDAAKVLLDRLDFQVLIVGDGPQRQELEQQATRLGIKEHVYFTGTRRDIPRLLKWAEVVVMPSLWEGLPLTALEAMAAGRVVVASRTQGLVDIIEDGKTGLLVKTGDVKQLAFAIEKTLVNTAFSKKIAKKAQSIVKKDFTTDTMVSDYAGLYTSR